jgi:YD repeat-containing protein
MTTDTEVINGHTYQMTRDDQGNVVAQVCQDAVSAPARPLLTKAAALIPPLVAGTATATQQQQALAALLALMLSRLDLS